MGKKSREKRERNKMSPGSRKVLKQLARESSPEIFVVNGKAIYFNPLKRILEGEKYKSDTGESVTRNMVQQYEQFLKTRATEEKLKKQKEEKDGN